MSFERSIRAALSYFDLFDHPLTEEELYLYLPVREHQSVFKEKLLSTSIRSSDGYFHLRSTDEIAFLRRVREKRAKRMLSAARLVGKIVSHFPFVRGVYLSGSLSKGVDSGNADIDLFIITAENRLWVCRTILTVFKKLFLLNSKKFLCLNYFLTERHLEIPEKNIFTATELITLRTLFNDSLRAKLLRANTWISVFYPNFRFDLSVRKEHDSLLKKVLELPLSDGYTELIDRKLMKYYRTTWSRRYSHFTDEERNFRFRSTPYSSKVHPHDFQSLVLNAYECRLKEENLTRLTRLDD